MIAATVRHLFTRNDAQLAVRLLVQGGDDMPRLEARLRDAGFDAILDDPRLLGALLETPQGSHASLPLFTYVVVRHALRRAGEDDRALAELLASIVVSFGARSRAERVSDTDDEIYTALADLLRDADGPDARRAFLVRMHLGHYALWLSGMFPDHIEHRRWRRGGPDLDYYDAMGAQGYRLAADHRLAAEHGVAPLFVRAAERFATLRVALNDVSDRLLFPHGHSPERLMRQVRSAMGQRWES